MAEPLIRSATPEELKSPEVISGGEPVKVFSSLSRSLNTPDYYRKGLTDYNAGADFAGADNDNERTIALTRYFGDKGFYKGASGDWFVTPDGLKKAGMKPSPVSIPIRPEMGAELTAISSPLGGSIAGAAAGAAAGAPYALAAGPLAAIPIEIGAAILSSGIGQGMGEAARQLLKKARGLSAQTSIEAIDKINTNVSEGMMGGLVAGTLGAVGHAVAAPYERLVYGITGQVPLQKVAQLNDMLARGYRPPLSYASPGPLWGIFQEYTNRIFGNPAAAKNFSVALDEYRQFLVKAGVPEDTIKGTVERILQRESQEFGAAGAMGEGFVKRLDAIKDAARSLRDNARKEVDAALGQVRSMAGTPQDSLKAVVSEQLGNARKTLAASADLQFSKVDELFGGPVVPTRSVVDRARGILADIVKTKKGEPVAVQDASVAYLERFTKLPDYVTFRQAQTLRSQLSDAAFHTDLTPGITEHNFGEMVKAADAMFSDAAKSTSISRTSMILNEAGKEITVRVPVNTERLAAATKMLEETRAWYAGEIAKFDDVTVTALARRAGKAGAVESERIAQYISAKGSPNAIARLRQLLPEDTMRNIARQDIQAMLREATVAGTDQVDGRALLAALKERGEVMGALHGSNASRIEAAAKKLAAYDGKLDLAHVDPGNFANAMERAVKLEDQAAKLQKTRFLANIGAGGQQGMDALRYLVHRGSPDELSQTIAFYGAKSQEVTALKQYTTASLFSDTVSKGQSAEEIVLSGDRLKTAISKIGRDKISALYGETYGQQLDNFAERLSSVQSRMQHSTGSSIAAVSLVVHLLSHLRHAVEVIVFNRAMATEGFIRWASMGLAGDSAAVKSLGAAVDILTREHYASEAKREITLNAPPGEMDRRLRSRLSEMGVQ